MNRMGAEMDTDLLVEKIQDGESLLRHLIRHQFDVAVALWVKITEDGQWNLFIASAAVAPQKPTEALRIVYDALTQVPNCSITPIDIRLLTNTDPIARDAIALRDRSPSREAKRFQRKRLGKLETQELFIYPRPLPWKVRELPGGEWQVLVSEADDQWLTCDSESDARAIASAPVLEYEALGRLKSDPQFRAELEKTADVMQQYRMGFGSRRLRGLAQDLRQ
jgi:hypothetical protein